MSEERDAVLLIHHLDLTVPFQTTVPSYVASQMAERRPVHVLCRKQAEQRSGQKDLPPFVLHEINTGDVPVVSGLLFMAVSTLYAVVLGAVYRYDAVYAFQSTMIQGWAASTAAGARSVVGIQSVPVRQYRDFVGSRARSLKLRSRVRLALYSVHATVIKALLVRASDVICLTEGIRDVTSEMYDVDLSDAHIIGMGVEIEKFAAGPEHRDGGRDDAWTVTYVGSINATRGIDQLFDAIAEVSFDVELVLAGSGTDEQIEQLKDRADALGIADRLTWLGLVPHDDVPKVLREADVAVSPLPDIESFRISFPAKLLEYMAAECLVVATDIPAHRRLIDDGTNGFLYDGSTSGLVVALTDCIEDRDRHDAIRGEARRTASQYRWEAIVRQHEAVLFPDAPRARI